MKASEEDIGDASRMAFKPVVSAHTEEGIKMGIEFDDPQEMSVKGQAQLKMKVKELTLFKTKKTMKNLDKNTFKHGEPELGGEVPPVIADEEEAKLIEERSEKAGQVT